MQRAVVVVLALAVLPGCAGFGTYMKDRGNDLLDCVKLQVGFGQVAEAQLEATQWVSTGFGMCGAFLWGIEGRKIGPVERFHAGIPAYNLVVSRLRTGRGCLRYVTGNSRIVVPGTPRDETLYETASIFAFNVLCLPSVGEEWEGAPPPRKLTDSFDIAIGVTFAPLSARAGFSLGQFADFLLGLTTLDVSGDDTGAPSDTSATLGESGTPPGLGADERASRGKSKFRPKHSEE
jgi:hypothetical protein